MGQKVNPIIFRIGTNKKWSSTWFANKRNYSSQLQQDVTIRRYLKKTLRESMINTIDIARSRNNLTITIEAAKPGLIIGRGGDGIEKVKKHIKQKYLKQDKNKIKLSINVKEIRQPNRYAAVVMQQIISDLERRIPFRRAAKQALARVEREGIKGAKIIVKGRLNGAEIARSEKFAFGSIPLHTVRADVDFSRSHATTTYGKIGVRVWIYKGDVFEKKDQPAKK